MGYISLEKLMKTKDTNLFKLCLATAMRANELGQGVTPLVESQSKRVTTVSLEEFAAGKVYYEEPKTKNKSSES